ncbi:uncharacterized protein LOC119735578 [Patiria miniata]|uniref:RING-type domain-containing protein n=1 Tax=Patiria miniata TaxID=46514 RepID=A0A914ANE3_PATMI|nr:uncharacterized protein LOC119735578 [Patiria miniata]
MASSFIAEELAGVKKRCLDEIEGSEIIACHPISVRVKITRTKFKQLDACLQFYDGYPDTPIVIEIKSKTIPEKLREGLVRICDNEAKKLLGKQQVMPMLKFIRQFIDDNPFTPCSEELAYIKKELVEDQDTFKTKQKAGVIIHTIRKFDYFWKIKLTVPDNYPEEQVQIGEVDHNFPEIFSKMFASQAVEIARQCVTPPLKKKPKDPPFEAKPSLQPVCEFLVRECVRRYPTEVCHLCHEKAYPKKPEHVVNNPMHGRHIEWMYCGHLFHHGCVDEYMKTPPFTGGKKCPQCGKRLYHNKWNVTPKLAEDRWAHHQARQRELEEVTDFLQ